MPLSNGAVAALVLLAGAVAVAGRAADSVREGDLAAFDVPAIGVLRPVAVGERAPPFQARDLDGRSVALGRAGAPRIHLVVFWSLFSAPARAQLSVAQRLHERHRDRGVDVLGVGVDGEPMRPTMRRFVQEGRLSFRQVIDPPTADEGFALSLAYGVAGTPTVFLVDRDGRIAFVRAGWTPEAVLEEAIGSLGAAEGERKEPL